MIRVLLVNPPSPERLGSPLLGQQYVAAALLARGCEVRVIDAAARGTRPDVAALARDAAAFAPQLIGVGLFTRWVWHAYALVAELRAHCPDALLVAGGAHTTVRPHETLARGFHVAVVGEAEETVVELIDHLEDRRALADIAGIVYTAGGATHATQTRGFVENLDALAPAHTAQRLYDPSWYVAGAAAVTPGGILTSRGCPARCTFCANYVTGRRFRHRAPAHVVAEIGAAHELTGATFQPFWDDALTANKARLRRLCAALERELHFPFDWSAITRANMVDRELLATMQRAGCVSVNFGVESGDDAILRAIKKGVTTAAVVRALEWAKALGLHTACNFMLGFPQESPVEVERTLRFMERIAPLVDAFSTLGVVVPFPGTPLYDDYHAQYGFTDWWLRADYAVYSEAPPIAERARYHRHYIDDANLALDFFHYDDAMRAVIRAALRFKGEHNLRRMGLLPQAAGAMGALARREPAAAARLQTGT